MFSINFNNCTIAFINYIKPVTYVTSINNVISTPYSLYKKRTNDTFWVLNEVKGEYYGMLLIITLGMFAMVSAKNLLMIYLAIEMVSIPSYIIAGISKNDRESNEASLKYVIYGSFASGIMLFGLSFRQIHPIYIF